MELRIRARGLARLALRVGLVVAVLATAGIAVLDRWTRSLEKRELARAVERGAALDLDAFLAPVPEGQLNGSDALAAVSGLLRRSPVGTLGFGTQRFRDLREADLETIGTALARSEVRLSLAILDLFAEAEAARPASDGARLSALVALASPSHGLAGLRAARILHMRAHLAVRDARIDDAYRDAALALRVAGWTRSERPGVVGGILGHAVERTALRLLEDLMTVAPPPAGLRPRLRQEVERCRARDSAAALRGERAVALDLFRRSAALLPPAASRWLPAPLTDWRRRLAEVELLATYESLIDFAAEPPVERPPAPARPRAATRWSGWIGDVIEPNFLEAIAKEDEAKARCELAWIGLAWADARDAGAAPATPADLVPAIVPALPDDPFSARPMSFARDGGHCRLWSIGRDRQDDGGVERPAPTESLDDDLVWELPCAPEPAVEQGGPADKGGRPHVI